MVLGISDAPTPAELFEEFHKRTGLRTRISNATMAIALKEVGSKSSNLPRYIEDGLEICRDFLSGLEFITETQPNFWCRDYPTKVLIDILTNRLRAKLDIEALEALKKGLKSVQEIFEAISPISQGGPDKKRAGEAKRILKQLDQNIASTYAIEDEIYRSPPV